MSESIKSKFFIGIAWTFLQNIAVKVFSFVFTVFLTRLLTPEDFGQIGMLSIFIAVSEVFIQSGFGQALVQKSDCIDEDFSTAFFFNVGVSLLIYCVLFIAAPLIAAFFHDPQLTLLTRILSLNFVIGSFNIVQRSLLIKEMDFKPIAIVALISIVVSGILGVLLAFMGYGVWALVAQTLCGTILHVFLLPCFTRWTPKIDFNYISFSQLWNYGSKILTAGILDVIVRNLSNILIGRFYCKEQVGYFSRAKSLGEVPAETMASILGTVIFPLLSNIHEDNKRVALVYKEVMYNTVFVSFPVILILVVLAKPIVIILFTERWLPCVPLLRALLLARIFLPLSYLNSSLLHSLGEVTLYMKLNFITSPLTIFAIVISIPFGVEAMAWATFLSSFVYYIINAVVVGCLINYSFINQMKDLWIILAVLLLMCCVSSVCLYLISNIWLQLVIGLLIGSFFFIICCKVLNLVDNVIVQFVRSKFLPFINCKKKI